MDFLTVALIILILCAAVFFICASVVLVKVVRSVNDLNKIVEENTMKINDTMEKVKQISDEFNAMTQKVSGAVKGVENVIHTPLNEDGITNRLNGIRKGFNMTKNILFSAKIVLDFFNMKKERKEKKKKWV